MNHEFENMIIAATFTEDLNAKITKMKFLKNNAIMVKVPPHLDRLDFADELYGLFKNIFPNHPVFVMPESINFEYSTIEEIIQLRDRLNRFLEKQC